MIELTTSEIARFQAQIPQGDGCWLWCGETNNNGYGRFNVYRRGATLHVLAHRIAFKLATGIDPAQNVVRHDCDTPACCNPAHLRLGTQADNMRDSMERGRGDPSGLVLGAQLLQDSLARALERKEKLCPSCATVKSLDDFHRARNQPDGRQGWCKTCRSRKLREAWRTDPEFRRKELARRQKRRAS